MWLSTFVSCTLTLNVEAVVFAVLVAAVFPLGYAMLRKLKVYAGTTHPHAAQQPKTLEI